MLEYCIGSDTFIFLRELIWPITIILAIVLFCRKLK